MKRTIDSASPRSARRGVPRPASRQAGRPAFGLGAALLGLTISGVALADTAHAKLLCETRSGLVIAREQCRKHETPLNVPLGAGPSASYGGDADVPLQNWTSPQAFQPPASADPTGLGEYDMEDAASDGFAAPQAIAPELTGPMPLVALTPCRLVDTRPGAPSAIVGDDIGAIAANLQRTYTLVGNCGIPSGAGAVSLNVTAVNTTNAGFLTAAPGGTIVGPPSTSTLNWSASNQLVANAAIVPLNPNGEISIFVNQSANVIVDTNGYFAPMPGDGSAGDVTISSTSTLSATNLQFRNFTVNAGVTLTVENGTEIRCTGSFTNNGTIVVSTAPNTGGNSGQSRQILTAPLSANSSAAFVLPSAGPSGSIAGFGEIGDGSAQRQGGVQGIGVTAAQARMLLRPGLRGGGGGGGLVGSLGGRGGGTLVVMARGAITNAASATISANGENAVGAPAGGGGGGGGIVVLASATSVTNLGTIQAQGGNGGPGANVATGAMVSAGGGGGGGGGIVHLLAPAISSPGAETVSGGTGATGLAAGTITTTLRQGGGGGGGSGGSGGSGATTKTDGSTFSAGTVVGDGHSLETLVNPQALMGF